jgi:hypothetical protein
MRRLEDRVKVIVNDIQVAYENVDWIQLAQDRVQ